MSRTPARSSAARQAPTPRAATRFGEVGSPPITSILARTRCSASEGWDPVEFACVEINARTLERFHALMRQMRRMDGSDLLVNGLRAPAADPDQASEALSVSAYAKPFRDYIGSVEDPETAAAIDTIAWAPFRTPIIQGEAARHIDRGEAHRAVATGLTAYANRVDVYADLGGRPFIVEGPVRRETLTPAYVGLIKRTTDPEERARTLGWLREVAATLDPMDLVVVGRAIPDWLRDEDLVRISQDPDPEVRAFLPEAIVERAGRAPADASLVATRRTPIP